MDNGMYRASWQTRKSPFLSSLTSVKEVTLTDVPDKIVPCGLPPAALPLASDDMAIYDTMPIPHVI